MIKPIEELDDIKDDYANSYQEGIEINGNDDSIIFLVHALPIYSNSQIMKIIDVLKCQSITVLIDIRSTNNFIYAKIAK